MKITRIHFNSIPSTNTWAKENYETFDPSQITLITATEQTAGRGRFLHKWHSPCHSNLYATFSFFCEPSFPHFGQLSIFFSLLTSYLLEDLGFTPKIKWPNDLLLSGMKIGGILCETCCSLTNQCIIAGIGLNINMTSKELMLINCPATSLLNESERIYDIDEVLDSLQKIITRDLSLFLTEGLAPFFDDYRSRLNLQHGLPFTFNGKEKKNHGIFKCLNMDGSITLISTNGEDKTFYSMV